jgi:hypothetical protein
MSRFYLLPSRPQLGERFASYLESSFPGLEWSSDAWAALAEQIAVVAASVPDTFILYREELPDGEDLVAALTDGFGAEAGDEIVEVIPGKQPRRWRIGQAA